MKTKSIVSIATALLLSTLNLQFSTCFAQGALTPPGAPAPTMKSLDQIQPRTPVNTLPGDSQDLYVITNSGSYYLTTNITATSFFNAILIKANGVTLDLNGFTISSTGANGTAILLFGNEATDIGNTDITIFNGHITGGVTNNSGVYEGPGFANGINYNNTAGTPYNIRVTGVSVSGCLDYGIYLDAVANSTIVESCTVRTVGSFGIQASTIKSCSVVDCGDDAITGYLVSDCIAEDLGSSECINAVMVQNCFGLSTGNGTGIIAFVTQNCFGECVGNGTGLEAIDSASGCYGINEGSGIGLDADVIAIGCYGATYTGTGLYAIIANSCFSSTGDGSIVNKYNMP